ncbi:Acetolactate synthase large subunit IlvG [Halotydeus destructor]|nr:Acetolactate synthase large subunit IlvG [Halotydeus destructor]
MDATATVSAIDMVFEIDYWGYFKSGVFYTMLAICAAQTFYPILMIIAMFIRQLGFLAQYFHEVDEKSEQHGGEIIGQVLKAHGVEQIFTLSSNGNSPICKGAEKNGVRVIETRHEVTAVAAADANSRLTGLPGVALVSSAPGITNTVAAIKAATKAESALVLVGQASSRILKGENLEVLNQMSTFKPLCKWTGSVDRIRDIAYVFREALRQALHGTPGPVYIQFNLDVLFAFPHVKKELDRKGHSWFLDYYIQNLFAAGFDVGRETRPWPIEIPFPKKDDVQKAVKAITKSEKPLILMGSQASLPPIEDTKIRSILQEMGIPCFLEGTARGILNSSSPLYLKHGLKEALDGADLVLVLGVPGDFAGKKLSAKTQVITVNRNKTQLKANKSTFGDHAVPIFSDVGQFLVEVSEKLGRFAISEDYTEQLKKRNLEGEKTARAASPLAAALGDALGEEAIIVSDAGSFASSVESVLTSKGSWVSSASASKLGAIAGYAIGAKLSRPEMKVACLMGVESLGYSLSELQTAANSSTSFLVVIGNDGSAKSVVDPATGSNYNSIDKAADSLGARGFSVSANDINAVSASLTQAVSVLKEGKPAVLSLAL